MDDEQTVLIDVNTGERVAALPGVTREGRFLFTDDSSALVTFSESQQEVMLWRLPPGTSNARTMYIACFAAMSGISLLICLESLVKRFNRQRNPVGAESGA
jgi:hypothetical protein